jgi:hypothetical protein
LAISLFQDSVELLARTIADECAAEVKERTPFPKLWECIKNARGNTKKTELPLQGKMLKLNIARVNFKHHGNLPDVSEGQKFSTYTEDFLQEAMESFFNKDFDKISLGDLIQDPKISKVVKKAEQSQIEGDFDACMKACAKADQMISGMVREIIPELPQGFSNFSRLFDREHTHSASSWVRVLDSYLRGLRHFSIAIATNIKLVDYVKFHAVIPDAVSYASGSWQFRMKRKASKEDAYFCLNYVINYALAVQEQLV